MTLADGKYGDGRVLLRGASQIPRGSGTQRASPAMSIGGHHFIRWRAGRCCRRIINGHCTDNSTASCLIASCCPWSPIVVQWLSASDLEQHTTMKYGQAETTTTHNHDGGHISMPCEQASSRPLWLASASACCTNEAQTCHLPGQTVQVDHEASGCQELRSRRGIMTSMATIYRQSRC